MKIFNEFIFDYVDGIDTLYERTFEEKFELQEVDTELTDETIVNSYNYDELITKENEFEITDNYQLYLTPMGVFLKKWKSTWYFEEEREEIEEKGFFRIKRK